MSEKFHWRNNLQNKQKKPKISLSGQICDQMRKMGLFDPRSRDNKSILFITKTRDIKSFGDINKEKVRNLITPDF